MSFESQQNQGHPADTDIDDILTSAGIEQITEYNPDFMSEFKQTLWDIFNAIEWATALGVYCPSPATFNVRGGKYLFGDTIKTYTPGVSVDPTNNDTTYIWMADANTVDYDIDGNDWPTTAHIKLAEIDVDADGIITAIRDLRGETFLQHIKNLTSETGTSAEMLPVFWDKGTPAANDEIRIPFYGRNSAGEKTEYVRIVVKLTTLTNGAEAATFQIYNMVAGTLTEMAFGGGITASSSDVFTNKTIDGDVNTLTDIALASIKTVSGDANKLMMRDAAGATKSDLGSGLNLANIGTNGGVPIVFTATLVAGSTVVIHNANAPFKYQIFTAFGIAKSGDGGTWQIKNGANAVTDVISVGSDKGQTYPSEIDDAYFEISPGGSMSIVGDGSLADVIVFIVCVRVS